MLVAPPSAPTTSIVWQPAHRCANSLAPLSIWALSWTEIPRDPQAARRAPAAITARARGTRRDMTAGIIRKAMRAQRVTLAVLAALLGVPLACGDDEPFVRAEGDGRI